MDKRVALVISVILAIIALLMVKTYVEKQKKIATKGLDLIPVVVAKRNISKGETLTEDKIAEMAYPQKYIGDRVLRAENYSMALGQKVVHNLEKGKPVLWSDIDLGRKEGFASIIQPGMRTVTLPVTSLSSASNMIQPGSRVDILLTFDKSRIEMKEQSGKKESEDIPDVKDVQAFREYLIRKYSKDTGSKQMTILLKQNVLVMSIGKQYLGSDTLNDKRSESYSEITLLTTIQGSLELIHAGTMGKMTFILRNDADVEKKVVTPITDESVFRSAITASISSDEDVEMAVEKE